MMLEFSTTTTEATTNWGTMTVGDVCKIQNGFAFKSALFSNDDGFPLIRIRDLKPNKTATFYLGDIESDYIVRNGDILIGMDGDFQPCLWRGGEALLNQRVCRLMKFSEFVEKDFIFFAIAKPLRKIEDVTHYTTVKHLAAKQVRDIILPAPPYSEQLTIATVLSKIQEAIAAQKEIIDRTRELKKALMVKLFTEGVKGEATKETDIGVVPESWEILPLSACAYVQTGIAKGRSVAPAEAVTLPYLRVANVQDGYLDLSEMKEITIRQCEKERFLLQMDDIVLTEGGDFDKLGRGFIWKGAVVDCIHQNHIFAVRVHKEKLLPEFFTYQSQSHYGKTYFLSVAHKTTNLACINTTKLKAFPVLLPSLKEQEEIVGSISAIDRKIISVGLRLETLQDLFKTMLHELMTGNIRTTGLA